MLSAFYFDTLSYPWVLLLLGGAAALFFAELGARAGGDGDIDRERAGGYSEAARFGAAACRPLLRALGLSALVIALAGPLDGFQVRKDRADVIDIMLCVDVSGSMQEQDFSSGGKPLSRLEVTKEAVRDFIASRKENEDDRQGLDRLGLILYAKLAWTQCPLTLDYEILEHELDKADFAPNYKDGTAIGSAIGLAVRRLSQSEAKSKVVVLLTDGLNNQGKLDPLAAAEVAKEYDMRVYTIGAGSTQAHTTGGFRSQPIDEKTLKQIAETTGAKYYRATDLDTLRGAYAEINALETTEIEIGDYYEYKEAFIPYVVLGALCLLASVFSRRYWFEPIP